MNSDFQSRTANPPLVPIATFVLWAVCLAAGLLGLRLGYPGPRLAEETRELPPVQIVNAQLTPQPAPPVQPAPPPPSPAAVPSPEPPAPVPVPLNLPERPAIVAVSPPSPALAFALPTEGLTRVVDASQAAFTRTPLVSTAPAGGGSGRGQAGAAPPPPKPVATAGAPAVSRLTFGEGEGRQPPPQYPRDAVLARQEGSVLLRFTVAEDGRVESVEVVSPSRWPLLNQAAARAVHDTWRFNPGPRRVYEVPMEFQLNH